MNLSVSIQQNVAVVAVTGDITHAVSSEFQSKLLEALKAAGGLVLDCSGIGMFTSSGLRSLLLLHREASGSGKAFVLAAVPPAVRDVMEVTGFWDQFLALPTVAEAIDATLNPTL